MFDPSTFIVTRTEYGRYWAEPQRNNLPVHQWGKDIPQQVAKVAVKCRSMLAAEVVARGVKLSGQDVFFRTSGGETFWVILRPADGAILCDESKVNEQLMTGSVARIHDDRAYEALVTLRNRKKILQKE